MKFSDFEIKKHPHFKCGIQMRAELPNGNGISIINGTGAYCDGNTFEIAPLKDGDLFDIESWGDQVRGYVSPLEIDDIIEHMYNDSQEEYYNYLNNFEFKNKPQSLGDLLDSVIETLK